MGVSLSWIAYRGIDRDEVLTDLQLADTGEAIDFPTRRGWGELSLRDGWRVIVAGSFAWATDERLARVSAGGEAIGGWVEEHVMISLAKGFKDGAEVWSVEHDPDHGIFHLATSGDLPPSFQEIEAHYRLEQEREEEAGEELYVDHIFEIPPKLTAAICGFDYEAEVEFRALRSTRPKSFLQKLFGG